MRLGLVVLAMAMTACHRTPSLPPSGAAVRLSVKTNPPTTVRVVPPASSGRPTLELGRSPIDAALGAQVGDTVVLENAERGIHDEVLIEYGQPNELKLISKVYREK